MTVTQSLKMSFPKTRSSRHDAVVRGPCRARVFAAGISILLVLGGTACSRAIETDESVELIRSRIESCTQWCQLETHESCGMGTTPAYSDMDGCIEQCATPNGTRAAGWGHNTSTESDACIPQWQEHYECVAALTCTDRLVYFTGHPDGSGPDAQRVAPEQRPCHDQWNEMSNCEIEAGRGQ